MPLESIKDCCEFVFGAIDGDYGWIYETLALIVVVVMFNFVVKWGLQQLHYRFEKQKKIWQDSFVRALTKPLIYYVWFFASVHLVGLLVHHVIKEATVENMHLVLSMGAVLALAWFLMRWKKNVVYDMLRKSKNHEIAIDITKIDVIDKVLTIFIAFTTILLLLEITDRSMNTIIAFGGVGGLAVAFASQEIIANFFAGLMIYATHPFAKGDWVIIPERNIEGTVDEIGWYMTLIKGMDKRPLYVPNSVFSRAVVINPSRMSHRLIKETIGLRYADMPHLKAIMIDLRTMLQHHPDIDKSPVPLVNFASFGTYSLDILVSAYSPVLDNEAFGKVKDDILFKIADILAKHNAEMAYPSSCIFIPEPVSVNEKKLV